MKLIFIILTLSVISYTHAVHDDAKWFLQSEDACAAGSLITTADECKEAAVELGWSDVDLSPATTGPMTWWPPGCFLLSNNLFFNPLTTSTGSCTGSTKKCACWATRGYVKEYPSTNPLDTFYSTTGFCETMVTIHNTIIRGNRMMSIAECEQAAVALGWSDVVVGTNIIEMISRPPGCFRYLGDGTLYYNIRDDAYRKCLPGTYQCACSVLCPPGTYQDEVDQTTCKSCTAGKYQHDTGQAECIACSAGQYSLHAASSCDFTATTCPAGTYATETVVEYKTKTSGTCTDDAVVVQSKDECAEAAVALGLGNIADLKMYGVYTASTAGYPHGCLLMSTGYWWYNTDTTSTTSCSSFRKCACELLEVEVIQACTLCEEGKYHDLTGQTSDAACKTCPGVTNDDRTACGQNPVYPELSDSLLTWMYCHNNNDCDNTQVKTCSNLGGGSSITSIAECNQAAVGLGWSDVVVDSGDIFSSSYRPPGCWFGEEGDIELRALSYNTNTGSTDDCSSTKKCACSITCKAGEYQDEDAQTMCKSCASGFFQEFTGQAECIACSPGTYSTVGASSCLDADAGYYVDSASPSSPTACAAGKYQDATGQAECIACSPGTYSPPAASSCDILCLPGTYQDEDQTAYPVPTYEYLESEDVCAAGSLIKTAAECEQAAQALDWQPFFPLDVIDASSLNWPTGCFLHANNGRVYFNTNTDSTTSCSSTNSLKCACSRALPTYYSEREEGACAAGSLITSKSECNQAAEGLGWRTPRWALNGYEHNPKPPGCTFRLSYLTTGVWSIRSQGLGVNTDTTSTVKCMHPYKCACKHDAQPLKYSGRYSELYSYDWEYDGGSGGAEYNEEACAAGSLITTEAECEEAAVELGWIVERQPSSSTGIIPFVAATLTDVPHGCFFSEVTQQHVNNPDSDYGYSLSYNPYPSTVSCSSTYKCACTPDYPTTCKSCPAGFFQEFAGRGECIACSPGTYNNAPGSTNCSNADAGYYVSSTAQTSQTACEYGTYNSAPGQSSCIEWSQCPTGQKQNYGISATTNRACAAVVTGCMNSTALNYYDTCKELNAVYLDEWDDHHLHNRIRWQCQDANVHNETTCVYACACKDDTDCQDYTVEEKKFLKGDMTGQNRGCKGCKELDEANNYDEYADEDDGTCEVTNYRCIDSHANNYDEDSTAEPLLVDPDPDGDYSKCTYDICPAGMYQDSGGCKKCADGTVSAKGSTECAVECPAGTERLDIDYHNNAAMYNRNSHTMNIGWTIYHVPSRYERACLSCADGKVSAVNADGPSINAFSLNHDVYKGLHSKINTTSDEITCSLDDCPSSTYKHGTQCLAECPEGTSVNGEGTVCVADVYLKSATSKELTDTYNEKYGC